MSLCRRIQADVSTMRTGLIVKQNCLRAAAAGDCLGVSAHTVCWQLGMLPLSTLSGIF